MDHYSFLFRNEYFTVWIYYILFLYHQLMNIRVVSTFWLLWITLQQTLEKVRFLIFWVYRSRFAGFCGNSMFPFPSPYFQETIILFVEPWVWAALCWDLYLYQLIRASGKFLLYMHLLPPFSRWGNWGQGWSCNLLQITHLVSGGVGTWIPESLL